MPAAQPLFERYPLGKPVSLSTGPAPTPYHVYQGYGVFIGGTAEAGAAQQLLLAEAVRPVLTTTARALMGIWVGDFTEASLGPHHALQYSFFVARRDVAAVPAHPLGLLAAMLARPEIEMLCHGLWNNTPAVVAYNREVLSLNARLARSTVTQSGGQMHFEFAEAVSGGAVLAGTVGTGNSLTAIWALGRLLGFGRLLQVARQPWVRLRIVNPRGVRLDRNAVARAFIKTDRPRLRACDPRRDRLAFGGGAYAPLGFTPHFVQAMNGFKFVYLEPD
jgi:hypothetical protein